MNAIILALGGVRASIFAGVAILLLLAAGVQTWRLGNSQDAYADYRDKVVAATAKASQAAATAREKAQAAVIEYQSKSAEAERNYQAGRESAIHAQTTLVSDLRNGNQRLQQQWRGCESDRVREGQAAAGTATGPDEQAELRFQSASRAIAAGDEADATVTWLQAELIATRELYGKCMVPKESK
ncbi:Rz-like spanin [Acinetobacter phage vB_AbaS_Silvergun]